MITTIAPEQHFYYDTYCTLNFATKSKKIVNINTTTVQEENPPVKSMAAVKPTKRHRPLIPVVDNKQHRNSMSSLSVPQEPNTVSYGDSNKIPIPSLFLRHQREFEATVQEKLQATERVFVEMQNSTIHFLNPHQNVHQSVTSVVTSPDIICPTSEVQSRPKVTESGFLKVLNTSTVKELQQLQTVVVKQAKAIYNFRTLHRPFYFIDTLKKIPGFTDKYIKKLLRRNLVTHSINTD